MSSIAIAPEGTVWATSGGLPVPRVLAGLLDVEHGPAVYGIHS